jgi:probable rRNA maturation factor
MTFYVENESGITFPFDVELLSKQIACRVIAKFGFPDNASIYLLITDNAGIRDINQEIRNIDAETDVLSFPNLEFERAGLFDPSLNDEADCMDLETGDLLLGDIVVSAPKVLSQASDYNHSTRREFAFLIAHSMLHLCGFDHIETQEALVMEQLQEEILTELGITRSA